MVGIDRTAAAVQQRVRRHGLLAAPRGDPAARGRSGRRWSARAVRWSLLLWGGWLVVTALVFSLMQGIVHPYYAVALAPALGGVIGLGAYALWERRSSLVARAFLSTALATALWTHVLMLRSATWYPTLRPVLLWVLLAAAALVLWLPQLDRWLARGVAVVAVLAALAGPTLSSVATAATPHSGSIPSVSPTVVSAQGRPGGGPRGGPGGQPAALSGASAQHVGRAVRRASRVGSADTERFDTERRAGHAAVGQRLVVHLGRGGGGQQQRGRTAAGHRSPGHVDRRLQRQ